MHAPTSWDLNGGCLRRERVIVLLVDHIPEDANLGVGRVQVLLHLLGQPLLDALRAQPVDLPLQTALNLVKHLRIPLLMQRLLLLALNLA